MITTEEERQKRRNKRLGQVYFGSAAVMAGVFAVFAPMTAGTFPWPADPIRALGLEVVLWLGLSLLLGTVVNVLLHLTDNLG